MREVVFAVAVTLACDHLGNGVDVRARDSVEVDDADFPPDNLIPPDRRVVAVAQVPCRINGLQR